jgi:hypothetical protein
MENKKIYIKAFNAGYLIEKYLPALSELLVKGIKQQKHPYMQGFIAGTVQCLKEKQQEQTQERSGRDIER